MQEIGERDGSPCPTGDTRGGVFSRASGLVTQFPTQSLGSRDLGREIGSANSATPPLSRVTATDAGVQTRPQVPSPSLEPSALPTVFVSPYPKSSTLLEESPLSLWTPPWAQNLDWPRKADPPWLRLSTRLPPPRPACVAYPWRSRAPIALALLRHNVRSRERPEGRGERRPGRRFVDRGGRARVRTAQLFQEPRPVRVSAISRSCSTPLFFSCWVLRVPCPALRPGRWAQHLSGSAGSGPRARRKHCGLESVGAGEGGGGGT